MDKKDLKILIRLHEIYEANLMLVSKDFEYSAPRDGYEHEYAEMKEILELLIRLMDDASERID